MLNWISQLDRNLALALLCVSVLFAYIIVRLVLRVTERTLGCLATALIAIGVLLVLYLAYYWLQPLFGFV